MIPLSHSVKDYYNIKQVQDIYMSWTCFFIKMGTPQKTNAYFAFNYAFPLNYFN